LVSRVEPVYPPAAKAANIQGVVILELVIGTDGTVIEGRVLRSIALLDQAALDAVVQWRYEPTLLNGAPVEVIATVTVNFSLP
jgi:protein TonB